MASAVYADSSFIVSLVGRDSWSDQAMKHAARSNQAFYFTPLHRIECKNALRNAAGRNEIQPEHVSKAFVQLDEGVRAGLLLQTPVDWTAVFRRAEELSQAHAASNGQRTIDLLHVAIAVEIGAQVFLSFDQRQCRLARAAGFRVEP